MATKKSIAKKSAKPSSRKKTTQKKTAVKSSDAKLRALAKKLAKLEEQNKLLKAKISLKEKRFKVQSAKVKAQAQKIRDSKPAPKRPRKKSAKVHYAPRVQKHVDHKPGESPTNFFKRAKKELGKINKNKQFYTYRVHGHQAAFGFENFDILMEQFEDSYADEVQDGQLQIYSFEIRGY